jgi:hypothetical protein
LTLEKDDIEMFRSPILHEREIDGAQARIFENRIYHLKIPRYKKVTLTFVEKGYDFINAAGGGRYFNIFEFSSFSDMDPEVRDWAADKTKNPNTYTDAIIVKSFAHKIIANFYLKFNRPSKPTKIFTNLESAVEWTLVQVEKFDKSK